jgi:hypothetical protein
MREARGVMREARGVMREAETFARALIASHLHPLTAKAQTRISVSSALEFPQF